MSTATKADFAQELRSNVLAIELTVSRPGRSRSLSQRHKDEVADHLHATRKSVTGSKKLFPPNQPYVKAIGTVLNEAVAVWLRYTIDYTKKGVRLLRRDKLDDFTAEMLTIEEHLKDACQEADLNYDQIISECRTWLGEDLFDPYDYPRTFADSSSVDWGVYNFEPSDELLQLAPSTYKRERNRVAAMFEASLAKYEDECRQQLSDLIDALLAKLKPEDGKKVKYTEAAASNLRDFFQRFKTMQIMSDEDMTTLIEKAELAFGDTTMADLKKSPEQRQDVTERMEEVKATLTTLIEQAPARAIDFDDLED